MTFKLRTVIFFYRQYYLIPLAVLYYFEYSSRASASEAIVSELFNGIEIVILYFE
jgi:hypothetical protein